MVERIKVILNEPLYQVAFFIFLFEAIFVPAKSFDFDRYCFHSWSSYISQHGISSAYQNSDPEFNYPPLISYPLLLFAKFEGTQDNLNRNFHFFKLFPLLFDFIGSLIVIHLARNKTRKIVLLLLLIVNPAFIYNSYCWGQCDSVLSVLVFISFLFLLKEKLMWGALFFVLAINFKVQAIVFLPPLLLLGFYKFWGKVSLTHIVKTLFAMIVLQIIVVLPFLLNGKITDVAKAVIGSVDYYPVISMNAYNIWYPFLGEGSFQISDKEIWCGMSYKSWGLLMFFGASFFALFPLFASVLLKLFSKKIIQSDINSLLILFALIPLLFFYFNTQMHERYVHPAFIFLTLFSFLNRKYFLFAIMCLAYFGNLEPAIRYFDFPNYKILIFQPLFVSLLYGLLIVSLFYFLYKPFVSTLQYKFNER